MYERLLQQLNHRATISSQMMIDRWLLIKLLKYTEKYFFLKFLYPAVGIIVNDRKFESKYKFFITNFFLDTLDYRNDRVIAKKCNVLIHLRMHMVQLFRCPIISKDDQISDYL